MNPLEEYIAIILYRQQNPLADSEYGEVHHIIPRSCGGCNKKWNKVKLTPEEHYKCHALLPKIYTEGKEHHKLVFAWTLLAHTVEGVEISEEEYGKLRREVAKAMSSLNSGRKHSEESRKHMGDSRRGKKRGPLSEETKRKISEAMKGKPSPKKGKPGKPHTEEWKRQHAEAIRGRHLSEQAKEKLKVWHTGKHLSQDGHWV